MTRNKQKVLYILEVTPGIKWDDAHTPICNKHDIAVEPAIKKGESSWSTNLTDQEHYSSKFLLCKDGPHIIKLPFGLSEVEDLVYAKMNSSEYRKAKIVNLDGILTPVSKDRSIKLNSGYFLTSHIKESRSGNQVVIYAGRKGSNNDKTQIFIDPKHKRVSFDQNNLNPTDVFTKIEVTFRDGTKHTIESGEEK